jgi:hypothetical protein
MPVLALMSLLQSEIDRMRGTCAMENMEGGSEYLLERGRKEASKAEARAGTRQRHPPTGNARRRRAVLVLVSTLPLKGSGESNINTACLPRAIPTEVWRTKKKNL